MDENLKQELASLMKDGSKKSEFAEMIVEYTDPVHISTDFVGMLLNARSLNPGKN